MSSLVRICRSDGCNAKLRRAPDLCQRCSAKLRNQPCRVDGCDRYSWAKELCSTHYERLRRSGSLDDPAPPKRRYENWAGDGYVMLYLPHHPSAPATGLIAEHRVVMEQKIGRCLRPGENVHHINGVRDDNRPENLELWNVSQPSGQRIEDKILWAQQFLSQYLSNEDLLLWVKGLDQEEQALLSQLTSSREAS